MSLSIPEFLSQKGSVELICEIDPQGSHFGDLEEELENIISHDTLAKRLDDGYDASLIEVRGVTGEQGVGGIHKLTSWGEDIQKFFRNIGLVALHEERKRNLRQFKEKQELAEGFLSESYDEFFIEFQKPRGELMRVPNMVDAWDEYLEGNESEETD